MAALPALAAAASAISGVVGAIGAIQSAQAQAQAADYNAAIQQRNVIIADQNRTMAVRAAEVDADEKRLENRKTIAAMRAAYGSSGVELAGSPLEVLSDAATTLELDASRVEYQGKVANREGSLQMLGHQEQATLDTMEADSARAAGPLNAMGFLIGGAGNALQRLA